MFYSFDYFETLHNLEGGNMWCIQLIDTFNLGMNHALFSALGPGAGELLRLLLAGEWMVPSFTWRLKNADIFDCFSGGSCDMFSDGCSLFAGGRLLTCVCAHVSVCARTRLCVCVCAHLDGTPPCEYREQRRNLNMRDHVETEMRCLHVNKINKKRPFSLFNKRASYRPVL